VTWAESLQAAPLRILAGGEAGEARRRIAEMPERTTDEKAWAEEVALAEDDARALAKVARRPPDFRA
jgi:hypothetical protein